ncbi:hypothetical protein GCM10009530_26080 [Microbispora corallina]|uniref:Glycosyltransferase RgtA/B/C/D-like domain-containing protein n=1 Tax=Microbispora corallina TaxID=83302 RepID=A0ABQ4G4T9_9ACTN|nr:hypothetical protein [Microbispora corallina]GIH42090.1 hypothetical protein Mco01_50900 [Microbispora corallina]
MEYMVVAISAIVLVFLIQTFLHGDVARRALWVLFLAFVARLVVHVLLLRSHLLPYGGDNYTYELWAERIVEIWNREGFQFVAIDAVSVPCNLFALVIYVCGGPAPLACTSVVAVIACALCILMYRFARLIGADERASYRLLVLTAFMPAFMLHTSDTFKDGFNVFCVMACLALATSNVQRFDIRKLLLLLPLLWVLWNVRPYMVFMCGLPLVLGFVGARRALPLCTLALLAGLLVPLVFFPETAQDTAIGTMQEQLERGQSEAVRLGNAEGGSGVVFDDGGNPWSAILPKLTYTVLSPFPWTGGSAVLQFAKIETLVWYLLIFHAIRGARHLWRQSRRVLMLLLLFVVPCTIVYATSMSNIGLIFRQRMPIVMVVSLLAAVAWTQAARKPGQGASRTPAPRPEPVRRRTVVEPWT